MRHRIIIFIVTLLLIVSSSIFLISARVQASEYAQDLQRLKSVGEQAGFKHIFTNSGSDAESISQISAFYLAVPLIQILLMVYGFLGIILALLVIHGGYVWLTAQGNEEKVAKARNILQRAAVGFGLLVGSVIVVYFVLLVFGQVNPDFITSSGQSLK